MDKHDTDRFRAQLLEERERLSTDMAAHRRLSDPNEDRSPRDFGDQGSDATGRMIEARLVGDQEQLVRKINHALERLDAGTYQQCEGCGGTIPLARLEAKPSASLCVACQQAKDDHAAEAAMATPVSGEEPQSLRHAEPSENSAGATHV